MADIFISYKSEDKKKAEFLAKTLMSQGWTVWWDRDLLGGIDYDIVIKKQLMSAKVVIVIWSEISIESRFVRDEARIALERNALLPVSYDNTKPPIGFGMIQVVFLNEHIFGGENFEKLFDSIRNKMGESGLDLPKQEPENIKRKFLRWSVAVLALIIVIGAIIFLRRNLNQPPQTQDLRYKAGKINEMTVFGRYDEVSAMMDQAAKANITREIFKSVMDSMNAVLGDFIKPIDTNYVKDMPFNYYQIRNQYRNGISINKIIFDSTGNIYGLWIERGL